MAQDQYLVGRYYDPATGQFLNVDPLVDETGQPYAYTGDDPVNGTDPLGQCWPSWACGVENAGTSLLAGAGDYAVSFIQTNAEGELSSFAGVFQPIAYWLEIHNIPNVSISNPICQDGSWYTGGYWGAAAASVVAGGAAGWADGASAAGEVGASAVGEAGGQALSTNATVSDLAQLAPGNPLDAAKLATVSSWSDAQLLSAAQTTGPTAMGVNSAGDTLINGVTRQQVLLERATNPNSGILGDSPIFIKGFGG